MNVLARRFAFAAALLLPSIQTAAGRVELIDLGQAKTLLAERDPCCVIDARDDTERGTTPVAHSLVFRKGMKINPTGVVVVIAGSDARALAVAEALAATSAAKRVVAIKDGARTWRAALGAAAGSARGTLSFIIPTNTCEQGPPLQVLRAGRQ